MIQLDGLNLRCIKWNCVVQFGLFEEILLLDEKKFSLRINEPLNQPWASNAIRFDVFPGNPFHNDLMGATAAGYETGGTSNIKFRMNGALTIGTCDGATIEMGGSGGRTRTFHLRSHHPTGF